MSGYHSLLITIIVLAAYFFTRRYQFHRKLWNIILLISFLVSGIFGLVLVFSIDNKLMLTWYSSVLWFHVEAGIVMAIVSIFHTLWHLPYFRSVFTKSQHRQ